MSRFLDTLSDATEAELLEDLHRVQEERDRLDTQESILRFALDLVRSRDEEPLELAQAADQPDLVIVEPDEEIAVIAEAKAAADPVEESAADLDARLKVNSERLIDVIARLNASNGSKKSKRGPIKSIMRSAPEKLWSAGEIREELRTRGFPMSSENARMTLRRMASAQEIEKVDRGLYKLPSSEASLIASEDLET